MKAVIQRVKNASVNIEGKEHSSIGHGMLILFCVEKGDTIATLDWFVNKVSGLRFFEDENGKMNRAILDVNGEILVVSQFTLAANCQKGTRPSFDKAEYPERANELYEEFVKKITQLGISVKTGVFGAMMDICLCNDGPVTFVLEK